MSDATATLARVERLAQNRPEVLDAGFYFEYGAASEQAGQPTRSENALKRAIQINPSHHPSLNYLGYMWAERGHHLPDALKLIEKAVQLSPGNPAYLDSQGWALFRLGHPQQAKPLLEEALRMVPDDPTLLEHSGDIYVSLGQTQQALDAYYKALAVGGPVVPLNDKIRANSPTFSRR
jgi:tetratricopeptide (TPR) repeat protein